MPVYLRSKGRTRRLRDGRHKGAKMREVGNNVAVYFEHLSPGAFRASHEFEVVEPEEAEADLARAKVTSEANADLEGAHARAAEAQAQVVALEAAVEEAAKDITKRDDIIAQLRAQVAASTQREEDLRARVLELEAYLRDRGPEDSEGELAEKPRRRTSKPKE